MLVRSLEHDEEGVFLCTTHPAKFLEVLEETLGIEIALPPELAAVQHQAVLSHTNPNDFAALHRNSDSFIEPAVGPQTSS